MHHSRQDGFSLPEMMVATAILATAIVGLAQLFTIATASNRGARTTTYTTILAVQKMEQLRGIVYSELAPSPGGALLRSTDGYADYLGEDGHSLGGGDMPPRGTAYVRRWSIDPLPADPLDTRVMQVLVVRGSATDPGTAARTPHATRLVAVRTRSAP